MADTAIVESGKQAVQQSTKRVTDYSLGISEQAIISLWLCRWQRR